MRKELSRCFTAPGFFRQREYEMLRRLTLLVIIGLLIFAAYANALIVPV